ncbi:hypothetical protein OSB04_011527 [Centaurea solstitialis]|uniref:Uncharacterized protein n=1 Tax=Centaurea solstitialis TaxID=347529 RepID=A0AA38TUC5_9ASTR|nr:hypothetical protein OSB04_011527 [Centaurea solstitialis]
MFVAPLSMVFNYSRIQLLILLPFLMRIGPDARLLRDLHRATVFIGHNLLLWSSEYQGIANAVVETRWLRNLLCELHHSPQKATIVYCDNVKVVYLISNPVQHQRTKHIEINIHFVPDKVYLGTFGFFTSFPRLNMQIFSPRDYRLLCFLIFDQDQETNESVLKSTDLVH